ncbi:hypothetical protein EJB05_03235, partial [Eragrostis curvula]
MADDNDPREREEIKACERVALPVSLVVIQLITVRMVLLSKLALNVYRKPATSSLLLFVALLALFYERL